METLILPCNHASPNSYYGRARQIKFWGIYQIFPNKFASPINSKPVLLSGFLIQILF
jgi:hypothetical protein